MNFRQFNAVATTMYAWMCMAAPCLAGKVVVANDDQTFGPNGFVAPNDAAQFARNIASYFTGGAAGHFLVYSNHPGLTNPQLAAAMTAAGHTWTVSTAGPFALSSLIAYDGVFVGGFAVDTSVLANYVASGGNVYLFAGAGPDGPFGDYPAEAAAWNSFLTAEGLMLADDGNALAGNVAISSGHALLSGVDSLYQNIGQDIQQLDPNSTNPHTEILVHSAGGPATVGLYAVSTSSSHPPILNDECPDAIPVAAGMMPYSTVGATSSGPFEEFPCTAMGSDIWFRFTPTCSGAVLIDLCGSNFDTILAVYDGCPSDAGQYVACNDDRCGFASRTDFFGFAGHAYYIRIGGFEGGQGHGTMTLTAEFTVPAGDVNADGSVGLGDLTILLSHFGLVGSPTYADGNLDGDNDVDLNDLTILLSNFGAHCQ